MAQYLSASRALTGDGKTVLCPAWIGFEGKTITYVSTEKLCDFPSRAKPLVNAPPS